MLFSKPLIDQQSANWIFETYDWALSHFDHNEFYLRTELAQPTNECFPGRVDSPDAKAATIFQHVQRYCGLEHWPFVLQAPQHFQPQAIPDLNMGTIARRSTSSDLAPLVSSVNLPITYTQQQTLKSEDLASSFAHVLAQHLALQSKSMPPGGADFMLEATELLAIFMGFGVLMANSAYTFRGGCGSCYNPNANRSASLTEHQVLFATALFCELKGIAANQATKHLKKHLKPLYKQAVKQVRREHGQLEVLRKYQAL
ncbi:MAG: hypothetical protein MI867_20640 [Pseudomonadales bacterium]|nr:hypothetical protein [Pseudomonadales bacterium]